VLFIGSAVTHMTIFQRNKKRGHKFIFNALLFGFSMARIMTSILRIASISLPHDIPLLIAAQIFTAAGVVLVFVINLFFTQRIIRAQHPHLGWHKLLSALFNGVYALIVISLVMLITVVMQSFYTRSAHIHSIDRGIQLYGLTLFAVVSFLPVVLLGLSLAIPRHADVDKFGSGRLRHNIAIVLVGSLVLTLGASFRAGTAYLTPVPKTKPLPAYYSRACFYVFNFTLEIFVLYFYALVRVDKRFHVPDGAKGAGSYSRDRRAVQDKPAQDLEQARDSVDDDATVAGGSAESLEDIEKARKLNENV